MCSLAEGAILQIALRPSFSCNSLLLYQSLAGVAKGSSLQPYVLVSCGRCNQQLQTQWLKQHICFQSQKFKTSFMRLKSRYQRVWFILEPLRGATAFHVFLASSGLVYSLASGPFLHHQSISFWCLFPSLRHLFLVKSPSASVY